MEKKLKRKVVTDPEIYREKRMGVAMPSASVFGACGVLRPKTLCIETGNSSALLIVGGGVLDLRSVDFSKLEAIEAGGVRFVRVPNVKQNASLQAGQNNKER